MKKSQTVQEAIAAGFVYGCVGDIERWCGRPFMTKLRADAHARRYNHAVSPLKDWREAGIEFPFEGEPPFYPMDVTVRMLAAVRPEEVTIE